MKRMKSMVAAAIFMLCAGAATAAVTAEEAKQLGTTLTPWGAEMAGNKEGTIPPYTGGLSKAPADFKPGSGIYPDPFKDEKPLFSITSKNMVQYADKLSEGQKTLLTRNPDYRMDIYPTHRTAAFPQAVLDATIKNATRATTTDGGVGIAGAEGGLPFPIPKNGAEVMWNHNLRYAGDVMDFKRYDFYADQQGRTVKTAELSQHNEIPYYQPDNPDRLKYYLKNYLDVNGPATLAGNQYLVFDPLDYGKQDRRTYMYIPGQRRVKLAPDLAYDTPSPEGDGLTTIDDYYLFTGKLDRYSFKLIGKKEMYIPYNDYKFFLAQQVGDPAKAMSNIAAPKFLKPDLIRFELHRVWMVEANLLPGKRHVYKKRILYLDEDGFATGMSDQYDSADKLMRSGFVDPIQMYDRNIAFTYGFMHYDFPSNVYIVSDYPYGPILAGTKGPGSTRAWKSSEWAPEAMAGKGVR